MAVLKTSARPAAIGEIIVTDLIDTNGDDVADATDAVFTADDMTEVVLDYDRDGSPDNRFWFDDRSHWVPDGDSFDDFENEVQGIPRGVTPVSSQCEPDGVATGPLTLDFDDYEPSSYCVRVALLASGPCVIDGTP